MRHRTRGPRRPPTAVSLSAEPEAERQSRDSPSPVANWRRAPWSSHREAKTKDVASDDHVVRLWMYRTPLALPRPQTPEPSAVSKTHNLTVCRPTTHARPHDVESWKSRCTTDASKPVGPQLPRRSRRSQSRISTQQCGLRAGARRPVGSATRANHVPATHVETSPHPRLPAPLRCPVPSIA